MYMYIYNRILPTKLVFYNDVKSFILSKQVEHVLSIQ